jgi:cell division protein DivIC
MENKKRESRLVSLVKNKYFIAGMIFLLWIMFFDENNLMAHRKNKKRLSALKSQKEYYQEKIESDNQKIEELRSGQENLEKYAREQFYMSKQDEDLFIVVEK